LRNIACQILSAIGQERTDSRSVPIDVCGIKIALIVSSIDLDMPHVPSPTVRGLR
jgi:hypothetical protein